MLCASASVPSAASAPSAASVSSTLDPQAVPDVTDTPLVCPSSSCSVDSVLCLLLTLDICPCCSHFALVCPSWDQASCQKGCQSIWTTLLCIIALIMKSLGRGAGIAELKDNWAGGNGHLVWEEGYMLLSPENERHEVDLSLQ